MALPDEQCSVSCKYCSLQESGLWSEISSNWWECGTEEEDCFYVCNKCMNNDKGNAEEFLYVSKNPMTRGAFA
jgi:hypothetical protein